MSSGGSGNLSRRYRELIWRIVCALPSEPSPDEPVQVFRARLEYLAAVCRAAKTDRELEDLARLQELIDEYEVRFAEMTSATADERYDRGSRVAYATPDQSH